MKLLFTFFITFCFSILANAQTEVRVIAEENLQAHFTYQQIKSNLPDYFFSYTLGGTNMDDSNLDGAALRARAYVVPIPVLITGGKVNSYDIWVNSFKTIDKETPKKNIVKLSPKEKIAMEQANNSEDSASIAKEKLKKEMKLGQANKKEVEMPKEKPETIEKKIQIPDSTNSLAPLSSFSLLPDSIKSILKDKGEELGYKWLYEQQVIAGNVLFCDTTSLIPIAFTIEGDAAIKNYNTTLKAWKRAYASIWGKSTTEQHNLIKNDIDAYFGQFGKDSSINVNFNKHIKMYQAIKNTISSN
jgi:hypothetical protein